MPVPATVAEEIQRVGLHSILALPEPIRRLLRGPQRRNARGDSLDPDLQLLLALEGRRSPLRVRLVDEAREAMRSSVRIVRGPPRPVAWIADRRVDGLRLRIYGPPGEGPHPVLLYAHGGGWCVGDFETHDAPCRRLAAEGGQIVVAVEYRLAPEFPFPAGLEDVLAAWRWVRQNVAAIGGRPGHVAVGGDSAGGNLAAAACLVLRDSGEEQPAFQFLVYPGADLRCVSESYREFSQGYFLTADAIQWYLGHYQCDPLEPLGSLVLAPDLRGLAPAIVVTAGFDPLRDDGELYAARLRDAGVIVEEHRLRNLAHGFFGMDGVVPACDAASARIVGATRRRWAERLAGER